MKLNKKLDLNLKLNSINSNVNDPTIISCTYIILDFEASHNNAIIDKNLGLELGESIINKPIVAKYIPVYMSNTSTDNFTGHEVELSENKHGQKDVARDTVPIGVFTSKGYILTINENGAEKEVLAADAVLWKSRYSDACELIVEWYNRGININTSSELLYKNFTLQDGIEYIHSPVWFEGQCHLASESRGGQDVVLPAYDSSKLLSFNEINKFNRLVAQAKQKEEGETMFFKKVFQLSHEDIRSKIYQVLDPTLGEDSFSYLQDVYDNHFIAEIWTDNEGYKYFDYTYSISSDDVITIDFDSKSEVKEKREWVKIEQQLQVQLNELTDKYNESVEQITTLAAQVEELKPFKEMINEAQFEEKKTEKMEFYSAKFEAVGGLDKFNSADVQDLVVQSINDDSEGKQAVLQLNSLLVELVKPIIKNNGSGSEYIKEFSSKREKLVDFEEGFESRYLQ